MPQQEHQLGDGRFGSAVISAYNAGLHQPVARFVAFHFYRTGTALGDVHNHNALFAGIVQAAKEPLFPGSIARTVCLQHHRFQSFYGEDGIYYALLNTGEEFQYGNIGIEQVVRLQPPCVLSV